MRFEDEIRNVRKVEMYLISYPFIREETCCFSESTIAIASASDSKLHQKVVRLGGTGLETEVKSKVFSKKLNPGDVVETKGHNLLAKRVMYCAVPESKPVSVHSVEGVRITEVIPSSNRSTISASTRKALSQCYSRSLDIAVKTGSRTVAFPSPERVCSEYRVSKLQRVLLNPFEIGSTRTIPHPSIVSFL